MKIIEFFGLPYAGKSYLSDFCLKFFIKKKTIYNNKSIFLNYLKKQKKISFFYYFYVKYKNFPSIGKRNSSNSKSLSKKIKSLTWKIKRFFFFKNFFLINKEKIKLFETSKRNYQEFHKTCIDIINQEKDFFRKKKLKRWLQEDFNGIYLAKNSNTSGLMIISEGFIQRVHSYYLGKDQINQEMIKKYFEQMPISDYIFYIKTDIEIIKKRLEPHLGQKKEEYYFKNIFQLSYKMNKIYKEVSINNKIYLVTKLEEIKKILNTNNFLSND